MTGRTVILHHHLFKNAGSSVDRILQDNFPGGWATREFTGNNNTADVARWIAETPNATAFSSHTMMGPLPRLDGVRIVSLIMLRDPIARIRSAYRFERRQASDNFGAVLAKATDFEGYVRVRLSLPHDRQCRSFQTWRLAGLVPGPEPELERARRGLAQINVVGLVEDFDDAMRRLGAAVADEFPDFWPGPVHTNVSASEDPADDPECLARLMREANRDDCALLEGLEKLRGVGPRDRNGSP